MPEMWVISHDEIGQVFKTAFRPKEKGRAELRRDHLKAMTVEEGPKLSRINQQRAPRFFKTLCEEGASLEWSP